MKITEAVTIAVNKGIDSCWVLYFIDKRATGFMIDSATAKHGDLADRWMVADCLEYGCRDALAMRGMM